MSPTTSTFTRGDTWSSSQLERQYHFQSGDQTPTAESDSDTDGASNVIRSCITTPRRNDKRQRNRDEDRDRETTPTLSSPITPKRRDRGGRAREKRRRMRSGTEDEERETTPTLSSPVTPMRSGRRRFDESRDRTPPLSQPGTPRGLDTPKGQGRRRGTGSMVERQRTPPLVLASDGTRKRLRM